MSRARPLLLAAALLAAAPALAQPAKPPAPAPADTAEDAAAIHLAESRGRMIRAYDQAAWHGTDDMLAKVKKPAELVGGYIVDGPADAPRLTFYSKDGTEAVYVAQFRGTKLISGRVLGANEDRSLGPQRLAMIAARAAGTQAIFADPATFACSDKSYNTVVLPPETPGGPMLVYLLTPQTANGQLPFGGHFRVAVDAAGKAGAVRSFTKGCLTIPLPGRKDKTAFVGVTHMLDPVPTEIHIFSSFATPVPILVILANREKRYYSVDNGVVTRLDPEPFRQLQGFLTPGDSRNPARLRSYSGESLFRGNPTGHRPEYPQGTINH